VPDSDRNRLLDWADDDHLGWPVTRRCGSCPLAETGRRGLLGAGDRRQGRSQRCAAALKLVPLLCAEGSCCLADRAYASADLLS